MFWASHQSVCRQTDGEEPLRADRGVGEGYGISVDQAIFRTISQVPYHPFVSWVLWSGKADSAIRFSGRLSGFLDGALCPTLFLYVICF